MMMSQKLQGRVQAHGWDLVDDWAANARADDVWPEDNETDDGEDGLPSREGET
jgi:hypothetical protein